MNIGVPKERRTFEFRVGLTPTGAQMLAQLGHTCYIEHNAGLGAGFSDPDYEHVGGRIAYSAQEVFGRADLLLKVARPTFEEIAWMRTETTVAGLLHLASTRQEKIRLMSAKRITALAYEQIQLPDGTMPVRRPLSQIGGGLAAQIGARLLQNDAGGKGIFLGGMAGIPPAEVVILGAGVTGTWASRAFLGMGAHVTILDSDLDALQKIYTLGPGVTTMIANPVNVARTCAYADIVVGAVYVTGERSPVIVTRDMVRAMKPRSVILDLSIDEGGCVETSRPTTHENPTFIVEGVIHYCVPNIPSVVARTSTYAFLNAAFPYIMEIANKGIDAASAEDASIEKGLQVFHGQVKHPSGLNLVDAIPH